MKAFHLTTCKFYRPKHDGLKIAVISDLHFSPQVKDAKLSALTNFLKKLKPGYIFLPGDLIDSAAAVDDPREAERLLHHLEGIAKVAPLFISRGNHDSYRRQGDHWAEDRSEHFFADLAAIKNVHLLDNQSFSNKDLYVLGFTQPFDYYSTNFATITHPVPENRDKMIQSLRALDQALLHNLPKHQLKFALIHSPVYLHDPAVLKELGEFDYFISGHMHNGVVPPPLDALWLSNKGIIAPSKNFFPSNVRRTIKTNDDKSIVAGPVTTFHEISGPLHLANVLYPTYVTLLEFTKDKKYARKPYVGHKYYKSPGML